MGPRAASKVPSARAAPAAADTLARMAKLVAIALAACIAAGFPREACPSVVTPPLPAHHGRRDRLSEGALRQLRPAAAALALLEFYHSSTDQSHVLTARSVHLARETGRAASEIIRGAYVACGLHAHRRPAARRAVRGSRVEAGRG